MTLPFAAGIETSDGEGRVSEFFVLGVRAAKIRATAATTEESQIAAGVRCGECPSPARGRRPLPLPGSSMIARLVPTVRGPRALRPEWRSGLADASGEEPVR